MASLNIRAVTFDCAQTLLEVRWDPPMFAVECAEQIGFSLPRDEAAAHYRRLLSHRHQEFLEMNLTRDEGASSTFWRDLTRDWAIEVGLPPTAPAALSRIAEEKLYGPEATVFRRYEDVIPALDALRSHGLALAVVSNWDVSLHRTLRAFELAEHFDVVVASLEEGVEKPDPAIFRLTLSRLGVEASEALHVGDDPLDDLVGAHNAGLRCLLIDRNDPSPDGHRINDLRAILGVLKSPS